MSLIWSILILLAADAVAIAVMLLIRRGAPEGSYFADGDWASGVFGVLATAFALLAGFVIFLAFSTYDQSRSGAEAEALTVVQQFETAQFLRPGIRNRLAGELVCYGRSYDKWLDQTSDREEGRRDRIHGAAGIVPTSLWIVLFLIAGVVLAYMPFFADSGELARSQAMLMGSATTVVVATLLAINFLDNPYGSGIGSIRPVAMERSLRVLDEARATVNDNARLPCNANGVAVSS